MICVCKGTCVQKGICGCISVGSVGRPHLPATRWSSSENHEHWLIHRHTLNRKYVFDCSFQNMMNPTETISWYYLAIQSLILNLEAITETTGLIFTGTGIYLSWLAEVTAENPSLNGKFSGMLVSTVSCLVCLSSVHSPITSGWLTYSPTFHSSLTLSAMFSRCIFNCANPSTCNTSSPPSLRTHLVQI